MAEQRTGVYEALFLVSQSEASQLSELISHIDTLFERCGATVLAMTKWGEQRLAFEMEKQRRGYYILAYFECDTRSVAQLERDCNLSEKIMRKMVIRAEHLTREQMIELDGRDELMAEARMKADRAAEAAAAEGDSSVSLGAPVKPDAGQEAAPEAEGGDTATATAEAPDDSADDAGTEETKTEG